MVMMKFEYFRLLEYACDKYDTTGCTISYSDKQDGDESDFSRFRGRIDDAVGALDGSAVTI
jgi:hypothetical protein